MVRFYWRRTLAAGALVLLLAACGAPATTSPAATTAASPAAALPTQAPAPDVYDPAPTPVAAPADSEPTTAPPPAVTVAATVVVVDASTPSPVGAADGQDSRVTLPSADESRRIADALRAQLRDRSPGTPLVVGATSIAGQYAVALVQAFGQPIEHAVLRRDGENWSVLEVAPGTEVTAGRESGLPQVLLSVQTPAAGIVEALMVQLQDPRGSGVDGHIRVEGIVDDYARALVVPSDPSALDPFTSFLRREGEGWTQLTGGTAFLPGQLDELGVPAELQAAPRQ